MTSLEPETGFQSSLYIGVWVVSAFVFISVIVLTVLLWQQQKLNTIFFSGSTGELESRWTYEEKVDMLAKLNAQAEQERESTKVEPSTVAPAELRDNNQ